MTWLSRRGKEKSIFCHPGFYLTETTHPASSSFGSGHGNCVSVMLSLRTKFVELPFLCTYFCSPDFCSIRKLEHVEVTNTQRRKSNLPFPVISDKTMCKPFTVED